MTPFFLIGTEEKFSNSDKAYAQEFSLDPLAVYLSSRVAWLYHVGECICVQQDSVWCVRGRNDVEDVEPHFLAL
jgi:hypothetical protein